MQTASRYNNSRDQDSDDSQFGLKTQKKNNYKQRANNDRTRTPSADRDDENYTKEGMPRVNDGRRNNGKNGYNKNDPDMPYNDKGDNDHTSNDRNRNRSQDYKSKSKNQSQNTKQYSNKSNNKSRRQQDDESDSDNDHYEGAYVPKSQDGRRFNGKNGYNKNDPNLPFNDKGDNDHQPYSHGSRSDRDRNRSQDYKNKSQNTKQYSNKNNNKSRRQQDDESDSDNEYYKGATKPKSQDGRRHNGENLKGDNRYNDNYHNHNADSNDEEEQYDNRRKSQTKNNRQRNQDKDNRKTNAKNYNRKRQEESDSDNDHYEGAYVPKSQDGRRFNGKNGYNKNDPNLPFNDKGDNDHQPYGQGSRSDKNRNRSQNYRDTQSRNTQSRDNTTRRQSSDRRRSSSRKDEKMMVAPREIQELIEDAETFIEMPIPSKAEDNYAEQDSEFEYITGSELDEILPVDEPDQAEITKGQQKTYTTEYNRKMKGKGGNHIAYDTQDGYESFDPENDPDPDIPRRDDGKIDERTKEAREYLGRRPDNYSNRNNSNELGRRKDGKIDRRTVKPSKMSSREYENDEGVARRKDGGVDKRTVKKDSALQKRGYRDDDESEDEEDTRNMKRRQTRRN